MYRAVHLSIPLGMPVPYRIEQNSKRRYYIKLQTWGKIHRKEEIISHFSLNLGKKSLLLGS